MANEIIKTDVVVDALVVHDVGVDAVAKADVRVEDHVKWSGGFDDAFVVCG